MIQPQSNQGGEHGPHVFTDAQHGEHGEHTRLRFLSARLSLTLVPSPSLALPSQTPGGPDYRLCQRSLRSLSFFSPTLTWPHLHYRSQTSSSFQSRHLNTPTPYQSWPLYQLLSHSPLAHYLILPHAQPMCCLCLRSHACRAMAPATIASI